MIISVGTIVKDEQGEAYILDEILGRGGFACVYKAHRERDGYTVAVKTLLSSLGSQDDILSFQKECLQAKLISSDHVIKYLYVHDGTAYAEYPPYIIMEYADGGSLADVIKQQRELGCQFELSFLQDVIMQLAKGMEEISKYLVHRDIKPENILIKDGIFKISDFGLSKISGDVTHTLTFKGYGSAKYVAPEGWNNDRNTIQMDIYSMGIVFYELATLAYPYQLKENADLNEYRSAHLYKVAKNPSTINPVLPQSLVSAIIKMLEKPTQKRFNNWDSVISALSINKIVSSENVEDAVTKALRRRNATDLKIQEESSKREKKQKEKEDACNLVYSQYEANVFNIIETFVESFNVQYSGGKGFKVNNRGFNFNDKFLYEITTPSIERISIETEVVFPENFKKQVPTDRIFGGSGYRFVNYIPQCKKRDIVAWSQVTDSAGKGFNILLLKAEDSMYGDWFILTNTNSALSRQRRSEPFGFSLKELPQEINHIDALHIYDSTLSLFEEDIILNYLAEHA